MGCYHGEPCIDIHPVTGGISTIGQKRPDVSNVEALRIAGQTGQQTAEATRDLLTRVHPNLAVVDVTTPVAYSDGKGAYRALFTFHVWPGAH
jgi:hypothetical protein